MCGLKGGNTHKKSVAIISRVLRAVEHLGELTDCKQRVRHAEGQAQGENVLLERVSHSYSIYALSISTTPPAIRLKPTETARFCSKLFILSFIKISKFRILPL